jgi:hypothetical protein
LLVPGQYSEGISLVCLSSFLRQEIDVGLPLFCLPIGTALGPGSGPKSGRPARKRSERPSKFIPKASKPSKHNFLSSTHQLTLTRRASLLGLVDLWSLSLSLSLSPWIAWPQPFGQITMTALGQKIVGKASYPLESA